MCITSLCINDSLAYEEVLTGEPGASMSFTKRDVAGLLGKTSIFGTLSDTDRDALSREMRGQLFASGQMLFSRGDPGNEVCLILKGRIRLSILSPEGRALSFLIAGPGDIFGEIAALDGGVRTADATAATEAVVAMLPRAALLRLIESRPAVAKAAIDFVCARLRATDDRLEAIALYPIEARLARFLISALRFKGITIETGRANLDLPMSQNDIACMIGASRPKVNGALSSLESSGAIRRDGDRIDCDLDRLKGIAEGEGA